jgi:hypothetical protein
MHFELRRELNHCSIAFAGRKRATFALKAGVWFLT